MIFKFRLLIFVLLVFFAFPSYSFAQTQLVAFPGADGFGKYTKGARGNPNVAPQVLKVTNLNDSGTGSLRWALTRAFPRFVVFEVTGIVELQSHITVSNPFITIAGQTAPGMGITLKNYGVKVNTSEVIIRGLKFRVGDEGLPGNDLRGLSITTTGATANVQNVIADHISATWGVDTNFNVWKDTTNFFELRDVTLQWSIFAESLHDSIHIDEINGSEPHSMGGTIGQGNNANISFHHNLMANNNDRNPRIAGVTNAEIVNNVIYNWGPASNGGGATKFSSDFTTTHIVNNYYINTQLTRPFEVQLTTSMNQASRIYRAGNVLDHYLEGLREIRIDNIDFTVLTMTPRFSSTISETQDAISASDLVLEKAGALPRDSVDRRIIGTVIDRTGGIIDSQNEVGGWPVHPTILPLVDGDNDGIPNEWEVNNPPMNPNSHDSLQDDDGDGYLNIEEYINSYYSSDTNPTPTTTPQPGDTNGDKVVDGRDYVIWLINYNQSALPNDFSVGNFNGDSVVDGLDYVIWLGNYTG